MIVKSSFVLLMLFQAKQLLKKMNPRSTAKMSIESNPYIFQYDSSCLWLLSLINLVVI